MSNYELQIKQVVDYPLCRMYRQFIQSLIKDRNIRLNGGSGLFYYTVLCSYANFRVSYRHIDGIRHVVNPGEWIVTAKELSGLLRTRFQHQVYSILDELQNHHLISYSTMARNKIIKYTICDWRKHNTVLDYTCPCQKESGFFFIPVMLAKKLISNESCSEMDMLLDMWISTIYNDPYVKGSDVGPVVYLRNGTGYPLLSYNDLATRWSVSRATAGRMVKHLEELNYIKVIAFTGRKGSVIYLENYLSTMFQISDVLIDKEEVAMVLNIKISLPAENEISADDTGGEEIFEHTVIVSDSISSVSKTQIQIILNKMANVLDSQGLACFRCPKSQYILSSLSDDCIGNSLVPLNREPDIRFGVSICCGEDKPVRKFELTLSPAVDSYDWGE